MCEVNTKIDSLYYELEKLETKYLVVPFGCVAS